MARWKLMTSHYLHTVEETKWEYKEMDRTSGKERRKQIIVPRFLDIKDPGDWTNRWGNQSTYGSGEGEIVVCTPGGGQPGDIEFLGDPTPDMMPVDDEAAEISAKFTERWSYKPDTRVDYSQSLVDELHVQMAAVQSKPQTVQVEGLPELVAALTSMAASGTIAAPRRV